MADKLTIIARIKAKPGKENQVKEELEKLVSPSRSENGCHTFDLHQSVDNAADFFFLEVWESRPALDKHMETPHVKNFVGQADSLLAEPINASFWKHLA